MPDEKKIEMDAEQRIDAFLRAGDLNAAATVAIETYGPEVLGFLVTFLRDSVDAREVFSQACEDLWRGLGRFERRSTLRTWFYVVARHAASGYRRSPHRNPRRAVPLSQISDVVAAVHSRTLPYLRSEAKSRLAIIRDSLEEDDRALLVLRIDRALTWQEVARVFAGDGQSEETIQRTAARLRKRFQSLKEKIAAQARAAGLLTNKES